MGLYRRFLFFKSFLMVLFFVNAAIFSWAMVSGFTYSKNQKIAQQNIDEIIILAKEAKVPELESQIREKLEPSVRQVGTSINQLLLIALLTLVFGVALPTFIFHHLSLTVAKLRVDAEKKFVKWMNWWLKTYGKEKFNAKNPFYQKPHFWMNMFLMFIETMAPQSRNPMVGFFGELAPVLRAELSKEIFGDEDGETN